jgi:hypothetical protein
MTQVSDVHGSGNKGEVGKAKAYFEACACDFLEGFGHFWKKLRVVELGHFSSMF